MNLSDETLRMAEFKFRHAKQDIVEEYTESRYQLQFQWITSSRLDRETAKLVPFVLRRMGEALVNVYLEAFDLEQKVPDHSDEAQLDRKIELLFARDHELALRGLPLGGSVQETEQRILEHLHAKAHEMRLRAKQPKQSNVTYSFQGDVMGGVAMGPRTTQNIEIRDEVKPRSKS